MAGQIWRGAGRFLGVARHQFAELILSIEELGNNNSFPEGGSIQSGSILCLKSEEMKSEI